MNSLGHALPSQSRQQAHGVSYTSSSFHIWPLLIFSVAALLPRELAVSIGGAVLFPYRLVLLALTPYIILRLLRTPPTLHPFDALAGLIAIWISIALVVQEPLAIAIEAGVALSLDFILAYSLGRVSLANSRDFRLLFKALLPVLAVVAIIQMMESIGHQQILRPLFAELLGQEPPVIHDESRFGLYRAAGPFQHPILGGVYMAAMLPMVWFLANSAWVRFFGVLVAASMIFTVSASAILAFSVCGFLIGLVYLQRWTGWPIWVFACAGFTVVLLLILTLSEGGPLTFAARRLSISVQTGYWRVFIWEFAGAEVLRNPFFGIGFREWARPAWMLSSSIDAHFLLWSVRFGLVAGFGLFVLMLGSAFRLLANTRYQQKHAQSVSIAIAISLIGIVAAGFSVAFWEGIAAWMTLLCGLAVTLGTPPTRPRRIQRDAHHDLPAGHAQAAPAASRILR